MSKKEFLQRMRLVRRDIGNLLFHFTRAPGAKVEIVEGNSKSVLPNHAFSVLTKILNDEKLVGSPTNIAGSHSCVCFTEAPITELASLFSLVKIAENIAQKSRYEPYGIAVRKDWLFSQGGRPVIYQKRNEYDFLTSENQFRHVTYDLGSGVDFTWEREWRIKTNELELSPENTLVIVPTAEEAFQLTYDFANQEPNDYDEEGFPTGPTVHYPNWLVVSLDVLGLELE